MSAARWVTTADTHTEGEPTRIITGGLPPLRGTTMAALLGDFRARFDDVRTALLAEPRGHADMFGAVLTQPVTPDGDWGLFFMHNEGYMNMCGHGTIGVSTALVELGLVPVREPTTRIALDTPAGRVTAEVSVKEGRAEHVTFRNAPAFVQQLDAPLEVPGVGNLKVDLAYGGNWFAFFDADAIGLELSLKNAPAVVEAGMRVMAAANQRYQVKHPEVAEAGRINIATAVARPADASHAYRNVHVFGAGQFDRSPGGTGTCARLAVLAARKQVPDGPVLVESVTGGIFRGKIVGTATVGARPAIIPEITGQAHLTGFHQFVLDSRDRLRAGFPAR